jgi:hypothetical protein
MWYTIKIDHNSSWEPCSFNIASITTSISSPTFEGALHAFIEGWDKKLPKGYRVDLRIWMRFYQRLREYSKAIYRPGDNLDTFIFPKVQILPNLIVRQPNIAKVSPLVDMVLPRKKGRPKKVKCPEGSEYLEKSKLEGTNAGAPLILVNTIPPRKRGRPKKVKYPEGSECAGARASPTLLVNTAPPRKRGRPRKAKCPEGSDCVDAKVPLTPPLSPQREEKIWLPLLDGCARVRTYEKLQSKPIAIIYSPTLEQRERFDRIVKYNRRRSQPPLIVSRSLIAGLGLFTTRPIPAGRRIIEYCGEIVGQLVADRREKLYAMQPHRRHDCYLFRLAPDRIIDATLKANAARFINHSCAPNCESKIVGRKIMISAMMDIGTGEELTYDYKFSRDVGEDAVPCYCGVPNCRKYMN